MRVFLDANILFSAARSDRAVRQLLKLLLETGHVLVADQFVLYEARRNLEAKSGAAAVDALHRLTGVFEVNAARATPDAAWLHWLPDKDRPVLAAAAALRCEALVTGDRKHFGPGYGKVYHGVTLLSPAMAAESLLSP